MQTFGLLPLSNMRPLCESIIKEYKISKVLIPMFSPNDYHFLNETIWGGGVPLP